jgi:hypothetical protein
MRQGRGWQTVNGATTWKQSDDVATNESNSRTSVEPRHRSRRRDVTHGQLSSSSAINDDTDQPSTPFCHVASVEESPLLVPLTTPSLLLLFCVKVCVFPPDSLVAVGAGWIVVGARQRWHTRRRSAKRDEDGVNDAPNAAGRWGRRQCCGPCKTEHGSSGTPCDKQRVRYPRSQEPRAWPRRQEPQVEWIEFVSPRRAGAAPPPNHRRR